MKCCRPRRQDSFHDYDEVDLDEDQKKTRPCWLKCLIITGIVLLSLVILLFLIVYVALPIAFMESLPMERFFTFMNIDAPSNPEFDKPEKYDMQGVRNFYVTTKDFDSNYTEMVSIGLWLVLPEDEKNSNETSITKILRDTKYPVVLYMHGVACNRALPTVGYNILRKQFLVIGVDYRGFGDSSSHVPLSETGVIHDNVQIYEWIRANTAQDVYVWGHSLGSALSTNTVKTLNVEKNIVPMGLILESAFTTMAEEILNHPLGQIFSWLPYFNQTFLNPLDRHGLQFKTTTNILKVDCPIMIMHAVDDNVIPYKLGRKLAEVARTQRNMAYQGSVTYHEFGALGYGHIGIVTDNNIPLYVKEFIEVCKNFKAGGRAYGP